MGVSDKVKELMDQLNGLVGEIAELEKPKEDGAPVDLSKLQDQIDALGKERDAKAKEAADLREAIKAHLDDDKADQAKLEQAIKPIEEVKVEAPVPDAAQEVVDSVKGDEPKPEEPKQDGQPAETNQTQDLVDVTKG